MADGKLCIIIAGYLTNTAYYAVERILKRSFRIIPDHETLLSKWFSSKRLFKIRFTEIPELQSGYSRFSEGNALSHPWQIFHHCRTLPEYSKIFPNAGSRQDPANTIYTDLQTAVTHSTQMTMPWTRCRRVCVNFSFQSVQ